LQQTSIPLKLLDKEKHCCIICYPSCKQDEFRCRLEELAELGVEAIEFKGEKQVCSIPVLGKGCVGIVVLAYVKGERVALKIRRTDADRATMQHEAEMLEKANEVNVGPRLFGSSNNFLLMEHIAGVSLPNWIKTLKRKEAKERIQLVIRLVLEQAWQLDRVALDHGELSWAPKHVIVKSDGSPCIVDFETASVSRKVSNVTSLCQYLFQASPIAKLILRKLEVTDKEGLLDALRRYKKKKDAKNFGKILKQCGVPNRFNEMQENPRF
jgi:putative serine/threonine protein kinase